MDKSYLEDFTVITPTADKNKPNMVLIRHDRNNDEIEIPHDRNKYPCDQAVDYVTDRGFYVIGTGEGYNFNYIICERNIKSTLKDIKK